VKYKNSRLRPVPYVPCLPQINLAPTAFAKCVTCRDRKTPCPWGTNIPIQLNWMKVAIHEDQREQGGSGASRSNPPAARSTPGSETTEEFQEASSVPSEDARTPSPTPSADLELTVRAFEAAALESEACYWRLLEGIAKAYTRDPPIPED
jgi:hypothetical protein